MRAIRREPCPSPHHSACVGGASASLIGRLAEVVGLESDYGCRAAPNLHC